jgi:hypothetical protein
VDGDRAVVETGGGSRIHATGIATRPGDRVLALRRPDAAELGRPAPSFHCRRDCAARK